MATAQYVSPWRDPEVDALGELATKFFTTEVVPHREKWESQQYVDREVWRKAGDLGLLCCSIPEEYGGGGGNYAHEAAIIEAQARSGDATFGILVHSAIVAHYIYAYGTEEQRRRWLPPMARGERIGAIVMTEPGTGSDLQAIQTRAVRDGDHFIVNGAKTFISNGGTADLLVVAVKTDPEAGGRGISLLVVETDNSPGFVRGRILDKVGCKGADTSELFFEDVRVPVANLLGPEGQGFMQLKTQLAQERLNIGISAVGAMEAAVAATVDYTKSRKAFGQSVFDFQNTRFELAECASVTHVARVFVDQCIQRHLAGELHATTAAMAKYWLTEQQCDVVDRCLQLFGGYGYMREYPIGRMYADARIQKIYGGTNEIMKEIVARSL